MKWFLFNNKEKLGPFSALEIESLARSGKVNASVTLSKQGSPVKKSLTDFNELAHILPIINSAATAETSPIDSLEVEAPVLAPPEQFSDWSRLSIDLDFPKNLPSPPPASPYEGRPPFPDEEHSQRSDPGEGQILPHAAQPQEDDGPTQLVDPELVKRRSQQVPVRPLAAAEPLHQQARASSEAHFELAWGNGPAEVRQWDRPNSTSLRRGINPEELRTPHRHRGGDAGKYAHKSAKIMGGPTKRPQFSDGMREVTSTVARQTKAHLANGLIVGLIFSAAIVFGYTFFQDRKGTTPTHGVAPQIVVPQPPEQNALVTQVTEPKSIQSNKDKQNVTGKEKRETSRSKIYLSEKKVTNLSNKQIKNHNQKSKKETKISSQPKNTKEDATNLLPKSWSLLPKVDSRAALAAHKLRVVALWAVNVGIVPQGCQPCRVSGRLPDGSPLLLVSQNRLPWSRFSGGKAFLRGLIQKEENGVFWILLQEVVTP